MNGQITTNQSNSMDDGFAKVAEAADYLGVCRSQIYKLMDEGKLRWAKFGRSRRIPRQELREFGQRSIVGESEQDDPNDGR